MIFCKVLSHKGTFCWKVLSKNIYTFYLKHQKYPFCAPIFHPLPETESYVPPSLSLSLQFLGGAMKGCRTHDLSKSASSDGNK